MRALRTGRLVFALVAFATLAVGATGGLLLARYRTASLEAVAEREALVVRSRAHLVGDELGNLVAEVTRLSHLAEIDLADGNLEPEKSVLRIARRDSVAFSVAIAILDGAGTVLWAEPRAARPGVAGTMLVGLARGRGRTAVHVAEGEVDVAAPIPGQGAIVAVVSGSAAPSLFGEALRRALRRSGEVALLLPGGGTRSDVVVASERAGPPAPALPPAGGEQAWVADARGHRWLVTEAVVGDGPLVLRLVQAAAEVEGDLSPAFERLLALVGVATVLAVGVGAAFGLAIRRLERTDFELARSRELAAMGKTAVAIAHEVKNSLNGLSIAVDLLASGKAPQAAAREVQAGARSEIARLRDVAEDLTLFAGPGPRLALAELDVGALCRRAAVAVSDLAADCEVQLDVEVPDAPLTVRGDEGRLLGAIVNLARNGVEAMGPGAFGETLGEERAPRDRRLSLSARGDGGGAVVEVRDRGPGLSQEVRARLFEPFVTTKRNGTGIGLAIVRRIAEAHGGRVEAAPREGGGMVFRLVLPAGGPAVGG